jgi:hypothetical protein
LFLGFLKMRIVACPQHAVRYSFCRARADSDVMPDEMDEMIE